MGLDLIIDSMYFYEDMGTKETVAKVLAIHNINYSTALSNFLRKCRPNDVEED